MPTEITFRVEGLEELQAALAQFPDIAAQELERASDEAGNVALTFLRLYPPPPKGFRMRFVSDKQRRWFFWALRTGRIEVPYRRTFKLGDSWQYETKLEDGALFGQMRNTSPYAEWVVGKRQARIHEGRWIRLDEFGEKGPIQKMTEPFEKAANRIVQRIAEAAQ